MISELIGDVLSNSRGLLAALRGARDRRTFARMRQHCDRLLPERCTKICRSCAPFLFAHSLPPPTGEPPPSQDDEDHSSDLFDLYDARPDLLLSEKGMAEAMDDPVVRAGIVTDTIASMTDKSAIEEHRRQFDLYAID